MKKQNKILSPVLIGLVILFSFSIARAQDTLPNFTLKNIGKGKILVAWVNNYKYVGQISIQRSYDSLTGYKSILTVPDPSSIQNGYVDTKAPTEHQFYRLFIVRENGNYLFSKAKRPVFDTVESKPLNKTQTQVTQATIVNTHPISIDQNSLNKHDLGNAQMQRNREDSLKGRSHAFVDTQTVLQPILLEKAIPVRIDIGNPTMGFTVGIPKKAILKGDPNAFAPSLLVFTHPDGNVQINLPLKKKITFYTIRFYDEDKNFLFELKDLKNYSFKLDKSNFLHAGWFRFEIYEEGKLIEKHKFQLTSDF
jgi:uncharacterized membrane protein